MKKETDNLCLEPSIDGSFIQEEDQDIIITVEDKNLNVVSSNKIREVCLFDQCGRYLKSGKKINNNKFSIPINFRMNQFMALFLKISLSETGEIITTKKSRIFMIPIA